MKMDRKQRRINNVEEFLQNCLVAAQNASEKMQKCSNDFAQDHYQNNETEAADNALCELYSHLTWNGVNYMGTVAYAFHARQMQFQLFALQRDHKNDPETIYNDLLNYVTRSLATTPCVSNRSTSLNANIMQDYEIAFYREILSKLTF